MDFIDFNILDAIDITIVALLMLQIYKMIRGTTALTIFTGIFAVYLLWLVVRMLNMELLSLILGQVIGVGVLALIIVFQQEVRRYLILLGNRYASAKNRFVRHIFSSQTLSTDNKMVDELIIAAINMSSTKTGALIAIERQSNLMAYSTTGDIVDAQISSRLIEAIFFKNSPMHDGAMIIKQERIHSARCILPSSDNPHIPAHLGMRHRAAIGLSEHGDALVLVVSEESGNISMVLNGEIKVENNREELRKKLLEELQS